MSIFSKIFGSKKPNKSSDNKIKNETDFKKGDNLDTEKNTTPSPFLDADDVQNPQDLKDDLS